MTRQEAHIAVVRKWVQSSSVKPKAHRGSPPFLFPLCKNPCLITPSQILLGPRIKERQPIHDQDIGAPPKLAPKFASLDWRNDGSNYLSKYFPRSAWAKWPPEGEPKVWNWSWRQEDSFNQRSASVHLCRHLLSAYYVPAPDSRHLISAPSGHDRLSECQPPNPWLCASSLSSSLSFFLS